MKVEIHEYSGGDVKVLVRPEPGVTSRELWIGDDEALAIHAALTEWKAKREAEKPKEPKLRPFRGPGEVPKNVIAIRHKGWTFGTRESVNVANHGFESFEQKTGHAIATMWRYEDAVKTSELVLADGSIVPCGVLE